MQWLARYKRLLSVRVGPVHLWNKGFFALIKIFEKSILKILKRGCRTQYDLIISSLSLAEVPSAHRFASLTIIVYVKQFLKLYKMLIDSI